MVIPIKITLAQINTVVGNFSFNSNAVVNGARIAKRAGADIALFPEMTLTGYPIEDFALNSTFQRKSVQATLALATTLE